MLARLLWGEKTRYYNLSPARVSNERNVLQRFALSETTTRIVVDN